MVRQGEINKAADQRRRELIEARNQADQLAYVTEKSLRELETGGKVGADDRRALEQLITEARRATQGEDVAAIRDAMNRLQQAAYRLSSAAYGAGPGAPSGNSNGQGHGSQPDAGSGEDVVEGEFRHV